MTTALTARRAILAPGQWVRNELWRRARAVPSLDLRFAESKSLVDATTGQSLVTFTRASSSTYVSSDGLIKTATTNEPRFDHNPTTGESLGLLVEEQRTNLLLRSEEFDNASWVKSSSTATANSAVAPDGLTTADTLVEVAATAEHSFGQTFSVVSGTTYTFSVFAKSTGASRALKMRLTTTAWNGGVNNQVDFNLTTGSGTVQSGTPTFTAQQLNNGWWRFSITSTATATGTPGGNLHITQSVGGPISYAGDGTSGIFLWGAQLEAGAFPTSYIPTTTATVTRSADVASITGTNFSSWYRQDEGTVFADVAVAQPSSGANQFVFRASDNGYNNSVAWNIQASGFASIATAAGGVFDGIASSNSALPANVAAKFAAGYQSNNMALSFSGVTPAIDTSATMPTALTRADIGSDHAGVNRVRAGTIRRLTYWPQRLPNSTIQTLTQ